jgi:hypothetical protein
MLENPELLREMVKESGAHQTNEEAPESAGRSSARSAIDYAKNWKPVR